MKIPGKITMDDNLFDEDDALDFVLYDECEKEVQKNGGNFGCLGMIVFLLIMPAAGILCWRCV